MICYIEVPFKASLTVYILSKLYFIRSCIDICVAPDVFILETRVPSPSFNSDLLSHIKNPFLWEKVKISIYSEKLHWTMAESWSSFKWSSYVRKSRFQDFMYVTKNNLAIFFIFNNSVRDIVFKQQDSISFDHVQTTTMQLSLSVFKQE